LIKGDLNKMLVAKKMKELTIQHQEEWANNFELTHSDIIKILENRIGEQVKLGRGSVTILIHGELAMVDREILERYLYIKGYETRTESSGTITEISSNGDMRVRDNRDSMKIFWKFLTE
jgi:hypothetical protein